MRTFIVASAQRGEEPTVTKVQAESIADLRERMAGPLGTWGLTLLPNARTFTFSLPRFSTTEYVAVCRESEKRSWKAYHNQLMNEAECAHSEDVATPLRCIAALYQ